MGGQIVLAVLLAAAPPAAPVAASLALGRIAQNPRDPGHAAAVVRLGELAGVLGDAASLDRFFGSVTDATVEQARSSPVALLAAKNRYDAERFADAIRLASRVERSDAEYPRAQLLVAAANVQLRKSVPAVQAAHRALQWLEEAAPGPDRAWLRDVARLAIARIYGATAVRLDENDEWRVDSSHLSAAVKHYEHVEPTSALFAEAAHELAWLYALAGDHTHAHALARWLSSPAASSPHALEGDAIRATSALAYCDAAAARAATTQLETRATRLKSQLGAFMTTTSNDAWLGHLVAAREGRMDADAALVVAGDRTQTRWLQYLARVDAEGLADERARVVAQIASSLRERVSAALASANARLAELRVVTPGVLTLEEAAPMRPRDRELDPWLYRLPQAVLRYESQLFRGAPRFQCAR